MSVTLTTRLLPAGAEAVAAAAQALRAGGLVAFPTETVYGLGADAANGEAVARLYAAKGRPAFNPLIAHVASLAAAREIAEFDSNASTLAEAFWPGPLTLVLRRSGPAKVSELALAGLDTIAVRVPAHPVAHAILEAFGGPVVAPSANRSGHVSPTHAGHVLSDLEGRIDLIVDGGPCSVGVESTIVACTGEPALLRPGGVSRSDIEAALRRPLTIPQALDAETETPLAPGMLESHYAPRTPLRLNAQSVMPGEALLAFGPDMPRGTRDFMNLSQRGDLIEAAASLFAHLRALDALQATQIAVMPVPSGGLGDAINDRLRRAAAPRSSS